MFSKIPMPINGKREISLYIHIPFCKKKCPYCHFYVIPNRQLHREIYLKSLQRELELRFSLFKDCSIVSIYFGGGTPSLFPAAVKLVMTFLEEEKISISKDYECTFETNPEDITPSLIQEIKGYGINRVSMGVQSLSNELLTILGRGHEKEASIRAVETVYEGGIQNISIDLMYDLPKQTLHSFEETLQEIEHLPITHLSLYNLTFEPHTVFYKRKKELLPLTPNPDTSYQMLQTAVSRLISFGFERYEISAFMKKGLYSRHNTGYWTGRPFLGFGPSAFSYWEGRRFQNTPHLLRYANALEQNQDPVHFSETLPEEEKQKELFSIGLRLLQGVELSNYNPSLKKSVDTLKKEGYLKEENEKAFLTEKGILFHDTVAEMIFGF